MHVIYIHTHDSGRILSPYGYATPTPNLTAFAKEAVKFNRAYCVSPTCSPSRSALLSGMYPHENGMLGLAQRGFSMDYNKHLVTFLKQHGFHSVLCGIQHEAGWYLDHTNGAAIIGYDEDITTDNSMYRQEDLVIWDQKNADTLCDYLQTCSKEKPLFISYGMYATHRRYPDTIDPMIDVNQILPPYPIPNNEQTRADHAGYLTSLKSADMCIGKVIEALKQSGIYDDSIIIVTTDHGLANPFSKCTLFDSGIGVALLMRVPNAKENGKSVDELVSHIDVFPTLCELLGFDKPQWLEGSSFASSFTDVRAELRDTIFAEVNFHTSYEPIRCVRNQRYKYLRYYDDTYLKINVSNIDESKSKDYFVTHDLDKQVKYQEALYDTLYDIGERNNLINDPSYQTIIEELSTKLEEHMKHTNDPLLEGEIKIKNTWKVNKKECLQASSKDPDDYISLGKET